MTGPGSSLARSMVVDIGGEILKWRPWIGAPPPKNAEERERRRHCNTFMLDFENWALRRWASSQGIPTGPERFKVRAWADHMKDALQDSDTSWDEYCAWVQSGGGDDWFQEDWEE